MKFDGDNVIAWDCFSRNDSGTLIQMKETMDGFEYCNILLSRMLPFTNEKMPQWSFRRDSEPKRPTELIKTFLLEQNVNMIKRPSQSSDLSRIEHLWDHVRRPLGAQSSTNKGELILQAFFFLRNVSEIRTANSTFPIIVFCDGYYRPQE